MRWAILYPVWSGSSEKTDRKGIYDRFVVISECKKHHQFAHPAFRGQAAKLADDKLSQNPEVSRLISQS